MRGGQRLGVEGEPLLGMIGIFSFETNRQYRDVIRQTWGHTGQPYGLHSRFVMRGLHTNAREEEEAFGDIFFLEELEARLSRRIGPLLTLISWMRAALAAWPRAQLIGKADDDVWVHLPGVALHAQSALAELKNKHDISNMLWGVVETFHWVLNRDSPIGFSYGYGHNWRCAHRILLDKESVAENWKRPSADVAAMGRSGANSQASLERRGWPSEFNRSLLIGPFPFIKCPLILITRELVSSVLADQTLLNYVSTVANRPPLEKTSIPWEDVFLGAALAHIRLNHTQRGLPRAAFVATAGPHFALEYDLKLSNITLIYHQLTKRPVRICLAHRWMAEHGQLPRIPPPIRCETRDERRLYRSCSGQSWLLCSMPSTSSEGYSNLKTIDGYQAHVDRQLEKPYNCDTTLHR